MTVAKQMLKTHPHPSAANGQLAECIDECFNCAQACAACADACLDEEEVQMLARCIRLNMDCSDICDVTAKILSRQTEPDEAIIRAQLDACRIACESCGSECTLHQDEHEHCRVCAEACRRCAQICEQTLAQQRF